MQQCLDQVKRETSKLDTRSTFPQMNLSLIARPMWPSKSFWQSVSQSNLIAQNNTSSFYIAAFYQESYLITGAKGPNVSSCVQSIFVVTLLSKVGSKKFFPKLCRFPPVTTDAPCETASLMCLST